MLNKLQNHLHKSLPFLKGKRLLVAVSGGIDSMVLVDLMQQLNYDITIAHCNFQLRGQESHDDEKFVVQQADANKIPCLVNRFETEMFAQETKTSIQIVARNLRYDWFETLMITNNFDFVVTAHHLDDSLETFLINFSRGTGIDGLVGIPQQKLNIIRPFLIFSRNEIETYAQTNQLTWREDSSNASDKYLRNKIRHQLIPVLKELNPSLLQSFEKTVESLKQTQSLALDASRNLYQQAVVEGETITFNIPKIIEQPNYQAYLFQWLQPYGFKAWQDIKKILFAQSGKQIFSEKFILLKDRETLILFPKATISETVYYTVAQNQTVVKFPLNLEFCNIDNIGISSSNTIFVDAEQLEYPLIIRKWKEGDVFHPFGMNGSKKISKFFKDEKFSLVEKTTTWLLCSGNKIVWIVGKRQDDRFKVTKQTTKIIQINCT